MYLLLCIMEVVVIDDILLLVVVELNITLAVLIISNVVTELDVDWAVEFNTRFKLVLEIVSKGKELVFPISEVKIIVFSVVKVLTVVVLVVSWNELLAEFWLSVVNSTFFVIFVVEVSAEKN